jgi:hypothetical protein
MGHTGGLISCAMAELPIKRAMTNKLATKKSFRFIALKNFW